MARSPWVVALTQQARSLFKLSYSVLTMRAALLMTVAALMASLSVALIPPAALSISASRAPRGRFVTSMVSIPFFGTKERSRKELREGIAGFYDRYAGP